MVSETTRIYFAHEWPVHRGPGAACATLIGQTAEQVSRDRESEMCSYPWRPTIGASSALAARTGSKYSRRKVIFPALAQRNTTYS